MEHILIIGEIQKQMNIHEMFACIYFSFYININPIRVKFKVQNEDLYSLLTKISHVNPCFYGEPSDVHCRLIHRVIKCRILSIFRTIYELESKVLQYFLYRKQHILLSSWSRRTAMKCVLPSSPDTLRMRLIRYTSNAQRGIRQFSTDLIIEVRGSLAIFLLHSHY